MQCANCGAELQPGATVCPSCEQPVVLTAAKPVARRAVAHERKPWQSPMVVAITVIVIVVSGWVLSMVYNNAVTYNTPAAVATRMMAAYGAYDAATILDNVTHSSLTAGDLTAFQKQVVDGKAANKGLPWVKDVNIITATIDPKDPNSATVQLSEMILDPAKGTYAPRNETLALVKEKGTWLVRLF
jgi:hypothetical protein